MPKPSLVDDLEAVVARIESERDDAPDVVRHNLDNVVGAVKGLRSALATARALKREDS